MFQCIPDLRGVGHGRSMRDPGLHLHPATGWKESTYQPCGPIGLTRGVVKTSSTAGCLGYKIRLTNSDKHDESTSMVQPFKS